MNQAEQDKKIENPKKLGRFGRLMLVVGLALSGCGDNDSPPVEPTAQVRAATGTYTETFLPVVASADEETVTATATNVQTETPTSTPEPTATNTQEPTPTNTLEPTATSTSIPTATETPQPTATETEVPKTTVVFDGNPNSEAGRALGDGGFKSDCDFGNQDCPTWGRIVWGPFARGIHHRGQGIQDHVTYRVTFEGKGDVRVGATDSKMYDGNMFGLGSQDVNLSNGPVTIEFYWEGIGDDENNLTGYGFETIAQQLEGEKGRIDNLKIEIVN